MIIPILGIAWGGEVLYDGWRVNLGPNAWFMVGTPLTMNRQHAASEFVFDGDSYVTERDCNKALSHLPSDHFALVIMSCRKLLLTDAAQMLRH